MTATIHRLDNRAPSLEPMLQLVAGDMNAVNTVILDRMQSQIPLIPELAGHLIAGGGKRMRPMLTLASARLRYALDGAFVEADAPLSGARELAIFPPVTGG